MKRYVSLALERWATGKSRRPLILRGARQVGKSYAVRSLAEQHLDGLVELNFERDPLLASCFVDNDPASTLRRLEAHTRKPIPRNGRTLLFLDEIQAAPELLPKLRWFAEELPRLPVVAAGSLLDFALAEPRQGMPVGRVSFLHLEPMGFEEFLLALGEDALVRLLREDVTAETIRRGDAVPRALHERLLDYLRQYVLVGGMPAAVVRYAEDGSLLGASTIHQDLLEALRADFAKYANRVHHRRLLAVLGSVPQQLGQSFKYTRADRDERAAVLKAAVELLCLARVCSRVRRVPAAGIPLAVGADERRYKLILLDVGLAVSFLGLSLAELERAADLTRVNSGAVAEQLTGQLLRLNFPAHQLPELYYWQRDERGSEAEVDYVVQHGSKVVPVEVKAGSSGGLKSLHLLMAERRWRMAVRFNSDLPSVTKVSVTAATGKRGAYELWSLPLYLTEQLPRLLGSG